MFNYKKRDIETKAKECNFLVNTTEKVHRVFQQQCFQTEFAVPWV